MSQEYRYHPDVPQVKTKRPKKEEGFFYIWTPIFVKWGIGIIVAMVALFAFEYIMIAKEIGVAVGTNGSQNEVAQYITEHYLNNSDQTALLIERLSEEYVKYTTQVEGITALVTIPFLLLLFCRDNRSKQLAGITPNKKAPLWMYSGVVAMSLALTLGINNLLLISGINVMDESYTQTIQALYAASFPVQIVSLGILIPICEELVFRGIMYQRMRRTAGFFHAAIVTSVVFGLLHANTVQAIYSTLLGFVFCYMYEKYGSVFAPVLAHIAANVFSVLLTKIGILELLYKDPVDMGIVTVCCGTIAAAVFVLMQRIRELPDSVMEEMQTVEE